MTDNYYSFVREQYKQHLALPQVMKDLNAVQKLRPLLKELEPALEPYATVRESLEGYLDNENYTSFLDGLQTCQQNLPVLSRLFEEMDKGLRDLESAVNTLDGNILYKKLFREQYRHFSKLKKEKEDFVQTCHQDADIEVLEEKIEDGRRLAARISHARSGLYQDEQEWKKQLIKYGAIALGIIVAIVLIIIYPILIIIPIVALAIYIYLRVKNG